ncbi:ExbD/TolR family protein [Marinobacter sp. X15-166B]|uniref:ExbD/TolR family protein n=1 Tax=Marinobacter sp. X15-166B TaxID=1897620 RepID=UPI00085BBFE8|nr:biopolymer transporter ExbD [Marinobacter sp. X15-166B]OEY66264.1 hypothetical protein BG841_07210 [Marinobacter sp. X15-166B]
MTPLIDVVFILLLFFMLTSSFVSWRQLEVVSPTTSADSPAEVQIIRLTSNQGRLEHDGRIYAPASDQDLAALVAAAPEAVFAIQADGRLHTQAIISLLDRLKHAGAAHVSLVEGP